MNTILNRLSQLFRDLLWGSIGWIAIRILLISPSQVRQNLAHINRSALTPHTPTEWQIAVGVLRMWYRMIFRSNTIGISQTHRPRSNKWARFLQYRPLRLPFVLWEGSVIPWDLSGLTSSPDRLICHVVGTHHEDEQFVYDLEILSCYPNALSQLKHKVNAIVLGTDPRSEWLQNLVVYEAYHKNLLDYMKSIEVSEWKVTLSPEAKRSIDISFYATLTWCSQQPLTPRETWIAWRQGTLRLDQLYLTKEIE